jgi:hypothetical protein
MNSPVYITITPEHVGKSFVKAFGEVIFAEHLNGGCCPCEFLAEDVGRRIYLLQPYQIVIEPGEQERRREAFFTVHYLCQLLDLTVLSATPIRSLRFGSTRVEECDSLVREPDSARGILPRKTSTVFVGR